MAIPIAPTSTYAYTNSSGVQVLVQGSALNNRGDWLSTEFYRPADAVTYQSALYLCVAFNGNTAPSANVSDKWAALVIVDGTAGSHSADQAYALAQAAYDIAIIGTNTATSALTAANSAQAAAVIAVAAGTNAQAAAAAATSAAGAAQLTANQSFVIAVAGTAAAQSANDLAYLALQTAWAGTTSFSSQGWAGTVTVDLAGPTYQKFNIMGATVVQVVNPAIVRGVTAILASGTAVPAALLFLPADIVWFGNAAPTSLPGEKRLIVNFTSFGSVSSEIHAASIAQA